MLGLTCVLTNHYQKINPLNERIIIIYNGTCKNYAFNDQRENVLLYLNPMRSELVCSDHGQGIYTQWFQIS